MSLKLGLVGLGKIARDQHLPAIAATPGLDLAAIASRNAALPDLPSYPDIDSLLAAGAADAVSLCTPPQGRFDQASAALKAGRHVMLEKPPGMTVTEVEALAALAQQKGVTLFTTWHSREAAAVEPARAWLSGRRISSVRVTWKEDVRHWHPGQAWIWEPGGLGVFDPGINALSIVTRILREAVFVTGAELEFPANRAAPIAASVRMRMGAVPVEAEFDWRQTGPQTWDIEVATDTGLLRLSKGGSEMWLDDQPQVVEEDAEYRSLYRRFVGLVAGGQSEVDLAPLRLVADAFLLARRVEVDAFEDEA
ncbi:Gfo/Idh/MocA family oxidoreductase [Cereibacter sp. SYSU M97828]|nr:Gfo/Idh/MocA family oxidoreductase [Cereibacter flavus]